MRISRYSRTVKRLLVPAALLATAAALFSGSAGGRALVRCHTADLSGRLGFIQGAAGSRIGPLVLKNRSRHTCRAYAADLAQFSAFYPGPVAGITADVIRGFEATFAQLRPDSLGLLSMRERAEALGGELQVTSVVGQGTQVLLSLPYSQNGLRD